MKQNHVKIRDVARKCGVSPATVSRAFSENSYVSSEKREKILACANSMGYIPPKQVRRNNEPVAASKRVMLIVGDLENPLYINIIKGVASTFEKEGILLPVYFSNYNPQQEVSFVNFAIEANYDGILMVTAMETEALVSLLQKCPIPVVLVNRFIRSMDLNSVCIDNCRGGYIATSYLIDRGHKKIAHLAGPSNSTASQDRLIGYRDALLDAGLNVPEEYIFHGNLKRDSGQKFAEYFLQNLRDCSAVFCANDISAMGFIEEITKHGLRIPDDLSIICFDDSVAITNNLVNLTTVSRDPFSMGEEAGKLMVNNMFESHPAIKIVFPPILNERESVKDITGMTTKT